MKKIKIDYRSLILAAITSTLTLVLLIIGLVTKVKEMDAFAAALVTQFGIAGLWILSKMGGFKGIFSGTKKMIEYKRQKFKNKHNIKEHQKKPFEPLGYIGPISMLLFGFLETIIYVLVSFI